jgi:hypothetical protein
LIKGVEVRGGAGEELCDLPFRDARGGVSLEPHGHGVKGLGGTQFGGASAQGMRVAFGRKVELGIERMQALKAAPAVTGADDLDGPEDALQPPPLRALMGVRLTGRVADRAGNGARHALSEVGLEQAAQQFAPFGLQELFQCAVSHALCLPRPQPRDQVIKFLVSGQVAAGVSGAAAGVVI